MSQIRLILIERRTLFRQGLAAILREEPEFCVVGEAGNADEAQRLCVRLAPDLILLDACATEEETPEPQSLLARLRVCCPQATIVVLGTAGDTLAATSALTERRNAIRWGADAYLCPTVDRSELLRTLRSALLTHTPAKRTLARRCRTVTTTKHPITERERAIIALVAQGKCNKEIAQCLGIGMQTVKNHISHLLEKLALADRTQLALYALERHFEF